MSNRYAAIIGSKLGTNKYQNHLRDDLVNDSIESIAQTILTLGDNYSFTLLGKKGFFKNPSAKLVRDEIEKIPDQDQNSVFFLYYYGHSEITFDNSPILAFKELTKNDSVTQITKKQCSFERLVEHIAGKGFGKVIIILDCCHSGMAATNITNNNIRWSLFSSTGSRVQTEDIVSNPFTQSIIRTLTDIDVREKAAKPGDTTLTIEALAEFVTKSVSDINGLSPQLNGNLIDFPIMPIEIRTPAAVNEDAPKKSLYYKLFLISRLFNNQKVIHETIDFKLLKSLLRREPIFFITDKEGKQVLISDSTLKDYMFIGILLKLWKKTDKDEWIRYSTKKIDDEGSLYNKYLVEGVLSHLPDGVQEAQIRKSVYNILHLDLEPTYLRIHKELQNNYGPWQSSLSQRYKKILISLLGYSFVLKKAGSDTYFPR